jgi:hypothetical protein
MNDARRRSGGWARAARPDWMTGMRRDGRGRKGVRRPSPSVLRQSSASPPPRKCRVRRSLVRRGRLLLGRGAGSSGEDGGGSCTEAGSRPQQSVPLPASPLVPRGAKKPAGSCTRADSLPRAEGPHPPAPCPRFAGEGEKRVCARGPSFPTIPYFDFLREAPRDVCPCTSHGADRRIFSPVHRVCPPRHEPRGPASSGAATVGRGRQDPSGPHAIRHGPDRAGPSGKQRERECVPRAGTRRTENPSPAVWGRGRPPLRGTSNRRAGERAPRRAATDAFTPIHDPSR